MKTEVIAENSNRIPVAKITWSAVTAPVHHWRLILWFALPLIVVRLVNPLVWDTVWSDSLPLASRIPATAALLVADVAAGLLLAVACLRIFALGEDSMSGQKPLRWSSRETRFLGWSAGIFLMSILAVLLAASLVIPLFGMLAEWAETPVPTYASTLMILPVAYLFARVALVLPATAADHRPTLDWALNVSRDNSLRLFVVIGLCPWVLRYLLWYWPWGGSIAVRMALAIAQIYIVAYTAAALSLCFRRLAAASPVPVPAALPAGESQQVTRLS